MPPLQMIAEAAQHRICRERANNPHKNAKNAIHAHQCRRRKGKQEEVDQQNSHAYADNEAESDGTEGQKTAESQLEVPPRVSCALALLRGDHIGSLPVMFSCALFRGSALPMMFSEILAFWHTHFFPSTA